MIKVPTLIVLTHPVDHQTPMAELHVRINLRSSFDLVLKLSTGDEEDVSIYITFC